MADRSNQTQEARSGLNRGAAVFGALGLAAMLLAAIALWAGEGGQVFVQSAFAALAACL